MRDDSTGGEGGVLMVLGLVLLLLVGGGIYFVMARQQQGAMRQAEQARQSEAAAAAHAAAEARTQAEDSGDDEAADNLAADDEASTTDQEDATRAAVESVLRAQEEAWNRGDVDAFAEGYWKSDDVTFSSGGKTTRGWEETVRGYRERYPTREKMGRLSFDKLEVTPLGDEAALVLGEWKLERKSEPVNGNFSLVFRKIEGRWVIVHDHTSRVEE
jgi:uncharacterized protein (TIGR02246 family)